MTARDKFQTFEPSSDDSGAKSTDRQESPVVSDTPASPSNSPFPDPPTKRWPDEDSSNQSGSKTLRQGEDFDQLQNLRNELIHLEVVTESQWNHALSKVGANASVHRVVTQLTEILSDRSMDQNGELTALTRYQARQILAGNTQHLRLGKYLILDELGAGGMGKVYKAYNPVLGRIEAIKIVSSTIMDGSPVGLARFAQEAKFLARLEHPFITTIYDSGTIRDTPFITMAYVPGRNLQRVVRDAKDANETLSIVWVLKAIKDLASALEYAHSKGIVHRDVKPNNIMLADSGQVCLLDLGLARMLRDDQEHTRPRLTDPTKRGMGTPEVMPPEQWASPSEVGPTSDIYSLGCTLFYLLSSTMPFKANSPTDYMHAHMNADRPDLSERDPNIPRPLARLVQKMMAIDPKDRFANCKELVESLNAIDLPTPKPIVLPQAPSARPRRALPIWLSILAMFVIASSATIYYRSRRLDYDKQVQLFLAQTHRDNPYVWPDREAFSKFVDNSYVLTVADENSWRDFQRWVQRQTDDQRNRQDEFIKSLGERQKESAIVWSNLEEIKNFAHKVHMSAITDGDFVELESMIENETRARLRREADAAVDRYASSNSEVITEERITEVANAACAMNQIDDANDLDARRGAIEGEIVFRWKKNIEAVLNDFYRADPNIWTSVVAIQEFVEMNNRLDSFYSADGRHRLLDLLKEETTSRSGVVPRQFD